MAVSGGGGGADSPRSRADPRQYSQGTHTVQTQALGRGFLLPVTRSTSQLAKEARHRTHSRSPTRMAGRKRPSPDPVRKGYLFDGWFIGQVSCDFSNPVTDNLTLTAKWTHQDPKQRVENKPRQGHPARPGHRYDRHGRNAGIPPPQEQLLYASHK